MKDKISIIVPIYNAEKYLENLIFDINSQKYSNWELILIDDGSYDNSLNICKKYKCSRIKIIESKHCGLPGKIRNLGIKEATGKYIMFVDADDRLDSNILIYLYKATTNNNADLSICNFKRILGYNKFEKRNDNIIDKDKTFLFDDILSYALKVFKQQNKNLLFSYCWGKLYRSDIIKNNEIFFNEDLYTFEDIDFNFQYLNYTRKIQYICHELYLYTIHNNYKSITYNTNFDRFFNYIIAINTIARFFKYNLEEKDLKQKTGNAIISMTILQLLRANVINDNKKFFTLIINCPVIRENLKYYRPNKKESILIPLLILLKFKNLLLYVIKYKSKKRYKKCA